MVSLDTCRLWSVQQPASHIASVILTCYLSFLLTQDVLFRWGMRNRVGKCNSIFRHRFFLGHPPRSCGQCGSGGRAVERRTVNRGDDVSKLRQFHSPYICPCLPEETLKAGNPFYLVSMQGKVKDPTQGVNV